MKFGKGVGMVFEWAYVPDWYVWMTAVVVVLFIAATEYFLR
ncbi:hypothetical protein [Pontibacillus chungwhensis]|nr:hypothetical protein [Pontibacillus chungwhensis]